MMIDMENLKVLLVEDDEIANFISVKILTGMGISSPEIALNGKLAHSKVAGKGPDLIFLYINMPVMDGFEFLAEVQKEKLCPNAKIIMLSYSVNPSDKQKSETFPQVIDYIIKPLTTEKIMQSLAMCG